MEIQEIIVVEGRDDTRAVKNAVTCETIETHGFGIRQETWELLEKASSQRGLIIFTDPDYSGELIRKRLKEKFPKAKEAFLDREGATCNGDVGIENASPDLIRQALTKAKATDSNRKDNFTLEDMWDLGLWGGSKSAEMRQFIGKKLGIGYGNSKAFLNKLNQYGITKEELDEGIHAYRCKCNKEEI